MLPVVSGKVAIFIDDVGEEPVLQRVEALVVDPREFRDRQLAMKIDELGHLQRVLTLMGRRVRVAHLVEKGLLHCEMAAEVIDQRLQSIEKPV